MKGLNCFIFVFWGLLCFVSVSFSGEIPEDNQKVISEALSGNGYEDAVIQFNLRVKIPEIGENEPADLWGTLIKHAGDEPLPTIFIATAYRREFAILLGATLFPRGYNILCVDARGTGASGDTWHLLESEEHLDTAFIVDNWIPKHPWSDGTVGMLGPSYLGILQFLASGNIEVDDEGNPIHLKAMFPIVPMSDAFKDIVFHGGNFNVEFMVAWVTLTDTLTLLPSTLLLGGENAGMDGSWEDPDISIYKEIQENFMDSIKNYNVNYGLLTVGENWVDGDFYDERSPMIYWPEKNPNGNNSIGENKTIPKNLPVFMVGGWYDIFTRGTLNHYQYGLSEHDVADKAMVVGPWYHADAAICMGVSAMMPTTNAIQARWFDWKMKGIEDPFMVDYPVMLFVMGEKKWRAEKAWPLPESRLEHKKYYLSKKKGFYNWKDWFSFFNLKNNYRLVKDIRSSDLKGDAPVLKHNPKKLKGWFSKSSARWLLGMQTIVTQASRYLLGTNIDHTSIYEDERTDEVGVLTFTTGALKEDIDVTGPLTLTFWAKTDFGEPVSDSWVYNLMATIFGASGNKLDEAENVVKDVIEDKDVQWVAEINDVFPSGRSKNITSGWLRASHRPYDPADEYSIDPEYVAYDPFYDSADRNPRMIEEGKLYKYAIEIWPTCNVFKKGHKIRVSLSGSDFPHLLPVMVPSENTIVIDEDHIATLEFTSANTEDKGNTWKWIEDEGKYDALSNYLLNHTD